MPSHWGCLLVCSHGNVFCLCKYGTRWANIKEGAEGRAGEKKIKKLLRGISPYLEPANNSRLVSGRWPSWPPTKLPSGWSNALAWTGVRGQSTRLRKVRVTLDGNTGKECCTIQNESRWRRSQLISQFVLSVPGVISFKYCFITLTWKKNPVKISFKCQWLVRRSPLSASWVAVEPSTFQKIP